MYNEFFGFRHKPFELDPDARFFYLSDQHTEALATLVYSIEEREGWALVAGEPGSGKTTLAVALLKQLGDQVWPAVITDPDLSQNDFFNVLGLELGFEKPMASKSDFLLALRGLITLCRRRGKALLIIIDDAQAMPKQLMLELLLLSRQDTGSPRVLNIFLLGTGELLYRLKDPTMRSLAQTIRRRYILKPLTETESTRYISHRLIAAGGSDKTFTPEAQYAIAQAAQGNPREINSLCDFALIKAFSRDQHTVSASLAREVIGGEEPAAAEGAERPTAEAQPLAASEPERAVAAASEDVDSIGPADATPGPTADPQPKRTDPERSRIAKAAVAADAMAKQESASQVGAFFRRFAAMSVIVALLGGGYLLANVYGPGLLGLSTERKPKIYIPPPPGQEQGKGPAATGSSQTGN